LEILDIGKDSFKVFLVLDKNYKTVLDSQTYFELVDCLHNSEIVAIDTETTGINIRLDKIIGASFSTKIGNGFYLPTKKYNPSTQELEDIFIEGIESREMLTNVFKQIKRDSKKVIMHNASFDTGIILNDYGIDLLPELWIETILAVHTVQEEGAFKFGKPFALKSIAQMYQSELGLNVEEEANKEQIELKESIHKNGGSTTKSKFEIYKADFEILSKYAAADTDLTLRVAHYFLKKIYQEGLEKFFFEDEVMPVYKEVTIPMERKGIALDIPLLKSTKVEIEKQMLEIRKEVIDELLAVPTTKNWLFEQCYVKSFPPKNRGKYAKRLAKNANLDLPLDAKGDVRILKSKVESLEDSPYKKFLLDEDSEHNVPEVELMRVSLDLWREANDGELINIQSKKHLAEIAFDFMGLTPISHTASGSPQFDDKFIESISSQYKWAEKLRIYNRLSKINSTYVDRLLEQNIDGVFYPYFKQHGTVSGRYGSDLQQLPKPKEDGEDDPIVLKFNNRIREFFICREGYKFIDSDYESLEPHIFASISNDTNLQEIFNKGHDFYSTVAIRTEKLEGVSADKKADNYLKKIDAPKRQKAKAYALGIAYGMSGFALSKSLNIKKKEGEKLRDAYLEGFPGVADWIDRSKREFEQTGMIKNALGRTRHLWRGKAVYDEYGDKLLSYDFRDGLAKRIGQDEAINLYRDFKNAYNSSLNFQIQSLAASIVNRAALVINRELKKRGWDGQVIAQIHDQLVIEVEQSRVEEFASIVQDLMENTTKLDGVTLKAPPEISNNFREGH
jgi:DNA polymerase I-like protein with 3'-5' exonuclease and polymerase domains